jgi:hypothetical protein
MHVCLIREYKVHPEAQGGQAVAAAVIADFSCLNNPDAIAGTALEMGV